MSIPLRVLIVEDSEDDANLLLRELRHGQYEPAWQRVQTAQTMHDALGRSSWELVISDYSLPAFSGIAALEILQEYALDIPFIMVSGAVGEAAAVSAMKAGAHDFVSKDNLGRLIPALTRELREAAARRQHRRAQHQLLKSEQRYRDLFQHNPSPMWVYDAATLAVLDANEAATALYGYSRDEFLALTVPDLHTDEERAVVTQRMLKRDPEVRNSMERRHRKKDGSLIDVEILSRPLMQNGKHTRMTTVKDITDRRRADQARAQLAAIVESSNDAIFSRDMDRVITSWNAAAERIFGWTAQEAIGKSVRIIVPPDLIGSLRQVFNRVLNGENVAPVDTVRMHKDGTRIHVQASFSAVRDRDGKVLFFSNIMRDITRRKLAEATLRDHAEQMRSLSRRLSEVEETERRNINRELHDRIGPSLVALKLNFHIMRSRLPRELLDTVGTQLEDAQEILGAAVEQLRNIMVDLRPPALDDYGLLAALRTYAGPYSTRLGVPVSVAGEDITPRLTPAVETALFRITQEALNNIAKHAQARSIRITVSATPAGVTLTVADDGIGFEPQHAAGSPSWGLRTMRERAQAIGAELRMVSAPGSGTRVVVEVPRQNP